MTAPGWFAPAYRFVNALTPEMLASTVHLPFGVIPMSVAITVMADHMRGHSAQIDYVRTIYGDHDWHL